VGYDRRSLIVVGVIVAIGGATGWIWNQYVSFSLGEVDIVLLATWLVMLAMCAWRVEAKRDLALAAAAFGGGALIETWGTRSGLWTYFTHEAPPLFILPAWPIAAVATERVSRVSGRLLAKLPARITRRIELGALAAFCILLAAWTRVAWSSGWTWIAFGCIAAVCATSKAGKGDLARFVGGSLLGYALEYWGTTRECWTYYDAKTPPFPAVLAHGFATVAFARVAEAALRIVDQLRASHSEIEQEHVR
jgi:hypothetical protein